MSCVNDNIFLNLEAKNSPNYRSKHCSSISNAYYALAASFSRKRKLISSKIIRIYTASKMSSGNSQLGPFSEGFYKLRLLLIVKSLSNIMHYYFSD